MSTPLLEKNNTSQIPMTAESGIGESKDSVDADAEIARERGMRVADGLRHLDMLGRELGVRGITDPGIAARARDVLEAKLLIRELASLAGVEIARPEPDTSIAPAPTQTLSGVRAL